MPSDLNELLEIGGKITFTGNSSWMNDYMGLYNDSYDDYNCCEGGDVCNLNEGTNFEAVFIPVLYSVAFVVGILGNGLLLGVLAQSRKKWNVTDTFILHLGVADVLLLVTLPLWAVQAAQAEGWTFNTPVCKITGTVFTINFYCGIFLLACISLDRYLSIVHATQMYSRKKPWVVHASCFAVWFFSTLLSIPDWMFLEPVMDDRREKTECVRNYYKYSSDAVDDWRLASRLLYHIVGFLIPSAVLIFCYSCILQRLRCGTQGLQKQKAFRVIMAVVVVFFLCWTPYNITLMVDTFHSDNSSSTCGVRSSLEKAKIVTSCVGYLHCCLNPILYAFVGVKFRRQLFNILRSLGCRLKMSVKFQSAASSRRSSIWSESADTSNSIAICCSAPPVYCLQSFCCYAVSFWILTSLHEKSASNSQRLAPWWTEPPEHGVDRLEEDDSHTDPQRAFHPAPHPVTTQDNAHLSHPLSLSLFFIGLLFFLHKSCHVKLMLN